KPIAGAIGEPSDKADRPESPVPSGFRRNGLICFVARLAKSMNYSLRRDAAHLKPLRPKRGSCGACSEVPNQMQRLRTRRTRNASKRACSREKLFAPLLVTAALL
ncbi:MAG TPA: hypothetical protein VF814_10395, partial [Casimicrobiaceae bacterium]